jgi:MoxR-like ATPase
MVKVAKAKVKSQPVTVQEKFATCIEDLNNCLIEREQEILMVLTALVAHMNPLLVGPPGTAKSLLLDSVMEWMGGTSADKFNILMTKFTVPEEICGPFSVAGMQNDEFYRITDSMLPEASYAFCDEIFKASSAILNTLLKLMNERTYKNGTKGTVNCPLVMLVGASNEWPNNQEGGQELGALFDRFLLRRTVRRIQSQEGLKKLLWTKNLTPKFRCSLSKKELDEAHAVARDDTSWTDDAENAFLSVIGELAKEKIFPGDRRLRLSVMVCQAYAYILGSDEVETEHLEILQNTLWEDPVEQPEKVQKVILRIANPARMVINQKLTEAEDVILNNAPTAIVPKLQEIQKALRAVKQSEKRDNAIAYIGDQISQAYRKITGTENLGLDGSEQ